MYLKKIELQGFKSFPEKIRLDFNAGITAVVGPNGSGKSNIADAVRWVLGEKSAKSLRGAKMEDVIFSGTANRKPMGFAEVSMIIDNSDNALKVDYNEVTVTRRVYRSGESDYLINGSKCRAKDILELFMDTGVGKEGYSIIGQGRIDEILSTKSEDRRLLFEEAAGIVKYRTRCEEAQNKLAKERENLDRVNDIITELEGQIGPLEKQAEKAKKAIALTERLKSVDINRFVLDVEDYEKENKRLEDELMQLRGDMQTQAATEQACNDKIASLKEDLSEIEKQSENNSERYIGANKDLEENKANIGLTKQSIEHNRSESKRLESENKNKTELFKEKENSVKALEASVTAYSLRISDKKKQVSDKSEALELLSKAVEEGEGKLNTYNKDIIEGMNKLADLKTDIESNKTLLSQLSSRQSVVEEEISTLRGHRAERQAALDVAEKELGGNVSAIEEINSDIRGLQSELSELTQKTGLFEKEKQSIVSELQNKKARLNALTELEKNHEGYYGGVKAVLEGRDKGKLSGICGAVGELINVKPGFETAIENAIGAVVQNIVVENEEYAKYAINELKRTGRGRATFLPITAISARPMSNEQKKLLSEGSVLGSAMDLVDFDKKYLNIISNLLERVLVIDNIDNAIAIARKTKYAYKLVTKDGDIFNVGGAMTGGATGKKGGGLLSRTAEGSRLKDECAELEKTLSDKTSEVEGLNKHIDELNERIVARTTEAHDIEIKNSEARNKRDSLGEFIKELDRRIQNIDSEIEENKRLILEGNEYIGNKQIEYDKLNGEIEGVNEELSSFRQDISEKREEMQRAIGETNELRLELRGLEGDHQRAIQDKERLIDESRSLTKEIESNKETVGTLFLERQELEDKIKELEANSKSLVEAIEELKIQKDELSAYKQKLSFDIDEQTKNLTAITATKSAIEKRLTASELKKEQAGEKIRELYNRMWDEYEVTYVIAKGYEKLDLKREELIREEKRLRLDIRALGNVNMNAVEEFRAVSERYDFLTQNRRDIIETENKLVEIIDNLNDMMGKQFAEQFVIIRENFAKTFVEMFGGGKADLKLSDSEIYLIRA